MKTFIRFARLFTALLVPLLIAAVLVILDNRNSQRGSAEIAEVQARALAAVSELSSQYLGAYRQIKPDVRGPELRDILGAPHDDLVKAAKPAGANLSIVRVYFATDRGRDHSVADRVSFDYTRGTVQYGSCDVSFPPNHQVGVIEAPSIFKIEWHENPEKHVVIQGVSLFPEEKNAFAAIRADLKANQKNAILVFIHGFGTTFDDAAKRTAQMKFDLGFTGPAVFFSWPSVGGNLLTSVRNYGRDEDSVAWSIDDIETFTQHLMKEFAKSDIYLISHSMGSRGLSMAFARMAAAGSKLQPGNIRQLILAAPDIDRDIFLREVVPLMKSGGTRITLYASSGDLALQASEAVHGEARLGSTRPKPFIADGIDTIDASNVATDFFEHDLPGSRSIISDIAYLVEKQLKPEERYGLEMETSADGKYWRLKP